MPPCGLKILFFTLHALLAYIGYEDTAPSARKLRVISGIERKGQIVY